MFFIMMFGVIWCKEINNFVLGYMIYFFVFFWEMGLRLNVWVLVFWYIGYLVWIFIRGILFCGFRLFVNKNKNLFYKVDCKIFYFIF